MTTNKSLWVAVVVVAIIAVGSYQFPKVQQAVLGAVSSLDSVDNPFVSINGERHWRGTIPMTATSTVLCAVQNPFTATTSITSLSAEVTNRGTLSNANNLVVSTSSTRYSSSTPALVWNHAMGTGQFSAEFMPNTSTSSVALAPGSTGNASLLPGRTTSGASNYILGPSEWVTWKIATSTDNGGGTFVTYMTGKCSLVLKKI